MRTADPVVVSEQGIANVGSPGELTQARHRPLDGVVELRTTGVPIDTPTTPHVPEALACAHRAVSDPLMFMSNKEQFMRLTTKIPKAIATCVAVLGVMSATSVGAAVAAPAKWNEIPAGGVTPATLAGTLTLKLNGGSPLTCPVSPNGVSSVAGNMTGPQAYYLGTSQQPCSNGRPFGISLVPLGQVSAGAYSLQFGAPTGTQASPYGSGVWAQSAFTLPFVNGLGGVASSVTLSNTTIGIQSTGQALTASGTLTLTRPGGTLTLS